VGIATVENFKKVSEFHSTLGELKNPGPGYESPAVDIIAELDAIIANIQNGQYANEYDFEAAMASVAGKSYDGHFTFHGNTFQGAVLWHRGESNEEGVKEAALISISTDGAALPQVYMASKYPFESSFNCIQLIHFSGSLRDRRCLGCLCNRWYTNPRISGARDGQSVISGSRCQVEHSLQAAAVRLRGSLCYAMVLPR
jgi:hypothetical protein